jgi:hypothetical protein
MLRYAALPTSHEDKSQVARRSRPRTTNSSNLDFTSHVQPILGHRRTSPYCCGKSQSMPGPGELFGGADHKS